MARPRKSVSAVDKATQAWLDAKRAGRRPAVNRAEKVLREALREAGVSWEKFYLDYQGGAL